jgi:hypothetical protein
MGGAMTFDDVLCLSRDELEQLYLRDDAESTKQPTKVVYHGQFLVALKTDLHNLLMQHLLFIHTPFGLTFSEGGNVGRWYMGHRRIEMARFEMTVAQSKWRSTTAICFDYRSSRLPFKAILYDEIKCLGDDIYLGMGGLDGAERDGFFFVLRSSSHGQRF